MAVLLKRALMEILTDWSHGAVDTWLAKYEAEGLPIQKRHLNTFSASVSEIGRLHTMALMWGYESFADREARPSAIYAQLGLARVHQRDPDTRGRSRPGRDDHEPGALFTGRRDGLGLTSAPLRVVFRRAPNGARHNARRVR
jgi:hypothetical protein